MPSAELETLFWAGGGTFTGAAVVLLLVSVYRWIQSKRANRGDLFALASLLFGVFYWTLLVDWGFMLRSDGIEVPWLRGIVTLVTFLAISEATMASLWLRDYDAWFVLLLQFISGIGYIGAEVFTLPSAWMPWGIAALAQVCAQFWTARRATRVPPTAAWAAWATGAVFPCAMLAVQSLSWTIGGVLDTNPERINSEIAYICAAGVGIPLCGMVAIFLFAVAKYREPHTASKGTTRAPMRSLVPNSAAPPPPSKPIPAKAAVSVGSGYVDSRMTARSFANSTQSAR